MIPETIANSIRYYPNKLCTICRGSGGVITSTMTELDSKATYIEILKCSCCTITIESGDTTFKVLEKNQTIILEAVEKTEIQQIANNIMDKYDNLFKKLASDD